MRGKRRGFTLIEVMVVLFITALLLPAIGNAFWMLLSVPPKETSKLTTINDVAMAFNWIRDDAMRAQYYSGSPQMLEKVIVIDFNKCNLGSDCNAWYSSGAASAEPDPGVGSAASGDNYNQIAQSDLVRWVTDGTEDNDHHYNYQVYEFTIDPAEYPRTDINRLSAFWKGYGEAHSGYDTTFRVWNHNSGSWETLVSRDALGADAALAGALDPTKHVSDAGTVYLLAKAEHYYEEEETCPYVFGWNGTGYQFIDEAIPDSFLKRYEETSYQTTTAMQPRDGYYDIIVHDDSRETNYINAVGLWAVDHPQGTEIVPEQPMLLAPGKAGTIHTIREPQPVTAVDRDGNDVTDLLAQADAAYWESELEGRDFSDLDNLFDWVTITLPDMRDSGSAKLVVEARESPLGAFQLWYCSHYLLGTPNLEYFLNRLETDEAFIPYFDLTAWQNTAFVVQYWDGKSWVDYKDIPFVNKFFGSTRVTLIDLSEIGGNQLRLHTLAGLREIDYVAVDYAPDEAVTVVEIEPAEVTQHFTDGTESDVLDAITAADDSYAVIEQGDYIELRFSAPAQPVKEGFQRTFVVPVRGYYYVEGPEVPFDWIDRLSLAEELTYVPYAFSKWTLPRYINRSAYPCSQYCQTRTWALDTPLFPPKETNSLNSNYVKLTLVVPKEEEEQTMESVVYGSFSWLDRTGSQSHSYTTQYYWDNGRMMREEWEDNNLRSSIVVAHNIENIEDVQFSFYPRGNLSRPPGKEGEAYLKVAVTSSAGWGDYRQVATSTEHYVLRGKGLGRGFAILARGRSGNPVDIQGAGLQVYGNVYSYRGVYIGCGEHYFSGELEATGQIDDPCGALTEDQLKRFSTRADTSWSLMLSDFVHLPEYKDREFVYDGSGADGWDNWDLGNCSTCYINKIVHEGGAADSIWEDAITLKTGVYYNPYGNVTLTTTNATGLVTLIGERVIVTADYSRLSALSNGVVAYATGTDDAAVWYNSDDPLEMGTVWSGSVFAPSGGVHIGGNNFAMYGVAAAMRFYFDGENATILY